VIFFSGSKSVDVAAKERLSGEKQAAAFAGLEEIDSESKS
jgi:hypothetical protein